MAETLEDLRAEITRLQAKVNQIAGPELRTATLQHGLQIIQGPDIAAIAIPGVSANNEPRLDAAAGHVIAVGTPPNEQIWITMGAVLQAGAWAYEAGVTQARAIVLQPTREVQFYSSSGGSAPSWVYQSEFDANGALSVPNISGVGTLAASQILLNGQPMGAAAESMPGYLRLGPITLLWGANDITTGGAGQTTLFIPYPIGVSVTLVVMATLQTTDDSVVWLATSNWGPTGFRIDVYRNASTGFLDVVFTWLAVVIT